jgi:hypothetical protein
MLYKYCYNCFSIDVKYLSAERKHMCLRCNTKGEFKEDSIDRINNFKKQGSTVIDREKFVEAKTDIGSKSSEEFENIDQRIKSKFGEKSKNSDWELL